MTKYMSKLVLNNISFFIIINHNTLTQFSVYPPPITGESTKERKGVRNMVIQETNGKPSGLTPLPLLEVTMAGSLTKESKAGY